MPRIIRPNGHRIIPISVTHAKDRAAEILREADDEAKTLRQAAIEETELQIANAAEKAHADAAQNAESLLTSIARAKDELVEEMRTELAALAVDLAGELVGAELKTDPDRIADIVNAALKKFRARGNVQLRLHPDGAALLLGRHGEDELTLSDDMKVRIVPDDSLGPADCLIDTEVGTIDGRLATKLDNLKRSLEGEDA